MEYFTISIRAINAIEEHFDIKLNVYERMLLSIINSFNSRGTKCQMGGSLLQQTIPCSSSTLSRSKKNLKKKGIITIWRDKNQKEKQIPDILHLSKETKDCLREAFQACTSQKQGPCFTETGYTNKSRGFTQPMVGWVQPDDEEDLNDFLNNIKI